ncbi:T-cell surface glycoprotein CD3 gamma chain-like isoform X1 [Ranitomeya variabilis]|uniref:T-cell surface glycoprotein CD3 gamma chain-like isoform X1 n=1 Tax=Ranitomeya variabilis TaxID=490064 RepID=UPI0040560F58
MTGRETHRKTPASTAFTCFLHRKSRGAFITDHMQRWESTRHIIMVTFYFGLFVAFLVKGAFSDPANDKDPAKDPDIHVNDDILYLKCAKDYNWTKLDGETVASGKDLNLGSLWNDPRGIYALQKADGSEDSSETKYLHVFVRRCMNCIELNPGTIAGFIVADVIMIGLIAMAVYFVSGSEMRRPARASDKQNLIENNADYQVLGRRDNDQYSHLAPRPKRGGF